MCIVVWHSRLERQSSKREIVGSSPAVDKIFHCVNLAFFAWLESANTNKINRDIHLAYTLLKLEISMYLLVRFSF